MKKMMKKTLIVLVMLLMAVSSQAQVFIANDEFEGNIRLGDEEYVLVVPNVGYTTDQYLPVGNGVLLLAGMGTAYLLTKRKKEKQSLKKTTLS